METRQGIHSEHAKTLDTQGLRKEFLQENIFTKDELTMTYSHIDRIVFGGILPVSKKVELSADLGKAFGVEFFLQRREIGFINVGSAGKITVDGKTYELKNQDALYVGMGSKEISFSSDNSKDPAKFYYNSAPAHCTFQQNSLH